METVIKKLKGSGGIPLKPRVGSRSHSQQDCQTAGQVRVADTLPEVSYQFPVLLRLYVPDF